MAKLSLAPKSTFFAKVAIPVAGEEDQEIGFTFKYRTRKELPVEFEDPNGLVTPADVRKLAEGWDLDDEFSDENIQLVLDQRLGAWPAIMTKYYKELRGEKEKN